MTTITSTWPSGGSQLAKRSSAPTRSGSSWQGMTTTIPRAGCGLALIRRGPADFCRYFSWDVSTWRLGNLASGGYSFNGITENIAQISSDFVVMNILGRILDCSASRSTTTLSFYENDQGYHPLCRGA